MANSKNTVGRRYLLGIIASGAATVAGCSGDGDGDSATPTDEDPTTPTPSDPTTTPGDPNTPTPGNGGNGNGSTPTEGTPNETPLPDPSMSFEDVEIDQNLISNYPVEIQLENPEAIQGVDVRVETPEGEPLFTVYQGSGQDLPSEGPINAEIPYAQYFQQSADSIEEDFYQTEGRWRFDTFPDFWEEWVNLGGEAVLKAEATTSEGHENVQQSQEIYLPHSMEILDLEQNNQLMDKAVSELPNGENTTGSYAKNLNLAKQIAYPFIRPFITREGSVLPFLNEKEDVLMTGRYVLDAPEESGDVSCLWVNNDPEEVWNFLEGSELELIGDYAGVNIYEQEFDLDWTVSTYRYAFNEDTDMFLVLNGDGNRLEEGIDQWTGNIPSLDQLGFTDERNYRDRFKLAVGWNYPLDMGFGGGAARDKLNIPEWYPVNPERYFQDADRYDEVNNVYPVLIDPENWEVERSRPGSNVKTFENVNIT